TLSEVGYAVRARRPVIFFDSHDALARALEAKRGEVVGVFADLGEPAYDPNELTRELEPFLLERGDSEVRRVLDGVPALAAARIAVELAAARPSGARLPDLRSNPLATRLAEFEAALRELERRLQAKYISQR